MRRSRRSSRSCTASPGGGVRADGDRESVALGVSRDEGWWYKVKKCITTARMASPRWREALSEGEIVHPGAWGG